MAKAGTIALAALPFVAVGAGLVLGRLNAHAEDVHCGSPTMQVFFDGQVFAAEPQVKADALRCVRDHCFVDGPEQVELHRDGHVRCIAVADGTTLGLNARSSVASMIREERPQ